MAFHKDSYFLFTDNIHLTKKGSEMPPYIKTVTSSFMLLLIYINLYKIKKGIRRCPFRNKKKFIISKVQAE